MNTITQMPDITIEYGKVMSNGSIREFTSYSDETDGLSNDKPVIQCKKAGISSIGMLIFNLMFALCFGGAGIAALFALKNQSNAGLWRLFPIPFILVGVVFGFSIVKEIITGIIAKINGELIEGKLVKINYNNKYTINGNPELVFIVEAKVDNCMSQLLYHTGEIKTEYNVGDQISFYKNGEYYNLIKKEN